MLAILTEDSDSLECIGIIFSIKVLLGDIFFNFFSCSSNSDKSTSWYFKTFISSELISFTLVMPRLIISNNTLDVA